MYFCASSSLCCVARITFSFRCECHSTANESLSSTFANYTVSIDLPITLVACICNSNLVIIPGSAFVTELRVFSLYYMVFAWTLNMSIYSNVSPTMFMFDCARLYIRQFWADFNKFYLFLSMESRLFLLTDFWLPHCSIYI